MSEITTDLATLLETIRRPGDYYVSGTVDLMAPLVEVNGVGPIALPLLPFQAEQLVAVADQAPYGRGEETLVDIAVRRTWQIGAERVRIQGKHWANTLEAILAQVADGLGVAEPISAEFYKLLVYDQGSFFVGHRDTEKAPGMFATLVIVLPSIFSGGHLVVRHKGREAQLDLRTAEPSEARFAAFYADCVHAVLPVTEGCRLTLIYNLVRPGRSTGPLPQPPDYDGEQARAAALLAGWATDPTAGPDKLIYPLEHAYTQAELGFETLKGADAAAAGVLTGAAGAADCDLHLALLSIEESGSAEYGGGHHRRWSGPDDDDFEVGEVCDRSESLTDWRQPDGGALISCALPVQENELSPPGALDDLEFDDVSFQEATGNAGASFERTYHGAALVLWPRNRFFAVLNQGGLRATVPVLTDLAERWCASAQDQGDPLWRQAHELVGEMLLTWPALPWYRRQDEGPSEISPILDALTRLGDREHSEAVIEKIGLRGGYAKGDNAALIATLTRFDPARTQAVIDGLVTGTVATSLAACANLLAEMAVAWSADRTGILVGSADRLVQALPDAIPKTEPWGRENGTPPVEPDVVVDLLTALAGIEGAPTERAAEHMLARPKVYDFDGVLVPAVIKLIDIGRFPPLPAFTRLLDACLHHLRSRMALALEPPKDWQRKSVLPCSCRDCLELGHFLSDASAPRWEFRAAEARRRHVEDSIRRAGSDVTTATVRQGSPHRLVCTKTEASYQRRVKQRQKDHVDLKRLEQGCK